MKSISKSPFTRSDFKDPILGSENWKQAFIVRFYGENVGRSFVVCSQDPTSELTKNLQLGAETITGISRQICRRLSSFKKSVG